MPPLCGLPLWPLPAAGTAQNAGRGRGACWAAPAASLSLETGLEQERNLLAKISERFGEEGSAVSDFVTMGMFLN